MITAYIINLACANAYYGDACRKASEAFAKQTQLEQNTTSLEQRGEGTAKSVAKDYLGDSAMKGLAVMYGGYKIYTTKSIKFNVPNYGIANHIDTQITPNSGQLNFRWNF